MNIQIENSIQSNVPWTHLPLHIRKVLDSNSKNYDRKIVTFSLKNQLRYRGNLIRKVLCDEQRYYERVVTMSRERLMLYPYHLADMIVKGLRITPFNYYISVIERLLQAEKSYDTLPNFTAADCLRLLGIGRNEYIDLMNHSRTKRSRLFGRKNVRELLPKVPCYVHIEPWWRIEVGMVLEDDIKMVNEEELKIIDELIDVGSQSAGNLDYKVVLSLYRKGLIYLDVPVTAVDRFQVPPLQGFVMNRVMGDYFETLLYKIFVSIDEHTTVAELANVLQVSIESVKQAVSLYCRLHFANKLEPETEQFRMKRHISWHHEINQISANNRHQVDITPLTLTKNIGQRLKERDDSGQQDSPVSSGQCSGTFSRSGGNKRIAFLYDSTLTAFLMMGNLSQGLKKHAVTMFEVGKLCEESMDSFLHELEKVSVLDADGEGEARRYFEHAVLLRSTILSLRRLHRPANEQEHDAESSAENFPIELDLVRLESLNSLDDSVCQRLLQKKYRLLVSMAPLSKEVKTISSLNEPAHLGPAVPEINSLWFKMFIYHMTGYGPPSLLLKKGYELQGLPRMFLGFSRLLVTAWLHEPSVIPTANVLHINGALQYAPVLVQAYGVDHVAEAHLSPFPFRQSQRNHHKLQDHSPVKINSTNHPAIKQLMKIVDLEHNCGYVTVVNIGVPDFGVSQWEQKVNLGRKSSSTVLPRVQQENAIQSPVESHFEMNYSSVNSSSEPNSPRNGYISVECNELLVQELDQLSKTADNDVVHHQVDTQRGRTMVDVGNNSSVFLSSTYSFDTLCSPTDEMSVNMFSRVANLTDYCTIDGSVGGKQQEYGQIWTILDCHFGIPLFDVDANSKICDNLLTGGLTESESLRMLTESNGKLSDSILEFISQCQYYPGENTSIIKRGRLIPLPKHNLAFHCGKVCEWSEK